MTSKMRSNCDKMAFLGYVLKDAVLQKESKILTRLSGTDILTVYESKVSIALDLRIRRWTRMETKDHS
jgi:hypothetical protein